MPPSRPPARVTVRSLPGAKWRGLLILRGASMRCALGRSGVGILKREGDGFTPRGRMAIRRLYYRRAVAPVFASRIPATRIANDLGWCDAVSDRNYNRPVRLPYRASHEAMHRADSLYDVVGILDWNIRPRRQNGGSAIFLHLATPDYGPTEGCIALSARDMKRLLGMIGPRTVLQVT